MPVVVNDVENDGAERVEASWTNKVLSSGITRAVDFKDEKLPRKMKALGHDYRQVCRENSTRCA